MDDPKLGLSSPGVSAPGDTEDKSVDLVCWGLGGNLVSPSALHGSVGPNISAMRRLPFSQPQDAPALHPDQTAPALNPPAIALFPFSGFRGRRSFQCTLRLGQPSRWRIRFQVSKRFREETFQ